MQTRKQEISEKEYASLTKDEKRKIVKLPTQRRTWNKIMECYGTNAITFH